MLCTTLYSYEIDVEGQVRRKRDVVSWTSTSAVAYDMICVYIVATKSNLTLSIVDKVESTVTVYSK